MVEVVDDVEILLRLVDERCWVDNNDDPGALDDTRDSCGEAEDDAALAV